MIPPPPPPKIRVLGRLGINIVNELSRIISDKSGLSHQITIDLSDRSVIKLKGYDQDSNVWFLINTIGSIVYETGCLMDVIDKKTQDYYKLKRWHEKALNLQLQVREDLKGVRGVNR